MADRLVGEREERLREALSRFVKATEKWSETNGIGWEDDANERDLALGWSEEWFAEVEVSNRDVLAARAALASSPSPPDREQAVEKVEVILREFGLRIVSYSRVTADQRSELAQAVVDALFGPVREDEG